MEQRGFGETLSSSVLWIKFKSTSQCCWLDSVWPVLCCPRTVSSGVDVWISALAGLKPTVIISVLVPVSSLLLLLSDSVRPHRCQPTRLPRPWDSPGKNTRVGCHFLLQCMKVRVKVKSLSRVRLLATPWTAAYQAPFTSILFLYCVLTCVVS